MALDVSNCSLAVCGLPDVGYLGGVMALDVSNCSLASRNVSIFRLGWRGSVSPPVETPKSL